MPYHQSSFSRIRRSIQVATHFDEQPMPRGRDHSPEQIQAFEKRVREQAIDLGGGPYPARDSVAFKGPEYKIDGFVRNGKLTPARPRSAYSQADVREQVQRENSAASRAARRERNARLRQEELDRERDRWYRMEPKYPLPADVIAARERILNPPGLTDGTTISPETNDSSDQVSEVIPWEDLVPGPFDERSNEQIRQDTRYLAAKRRRERLEREEAEAAGLREYDPRVPRYFPDPFELLRHA